MRACQCHFPNDRQVAGLAEDIASTVGLSCGEIWVPVNEARGQFCSLHTIVGTAWLLMFLDFSYKCHVSGK